MTECPKSIRPKQIDFAVELSKVAVTLHLLKWFFDWDHILSQRYAMAIIAGNFVFIVVVILIVRGFRKAKGWASAILFGLTGVALGHTVFDVGYLQTFQESMLLGTISLIQAGSLVLASSLLFTKSAESWLKASGHRG